MNFASQIMMQSQLNISNVPLTLLPIPKNSTPAEESSLSVLNTVLENVIRQIHRKDLEKELNGKVSEKIVTATNNYHEIFDRLKILSQLQQSQKLKVMSLEDAEPVT